MATHTRLVMSKRWKPSRAETNICSMTQSAQLIPVIITSVENSLRWAGATLKKCSTRHDIPSVTVMMSTEMKKK